MIDKNNNELLIRTAVWSCLRLIKRSPSSQKNTTSQDQNFASLQFGWNLTVHNVLGFRNDFGELLRKYCWIRWVETRAKMNVVDVPHINTLYRFCRKFLPSSESIKFHLEYRIPPDVYKWNVTSRIGLEITMTLRFTLGFFFRSPVERCNVSLECAHFT